MKYKALNIASLSLFTAIFLSVATCFAETESTVGYIFPEAQALRIVAPTTWYGTIQIWNDHTGRHAHLNVTREKIDAKDPKSMFQCGVTVLINLAVLNQLNDTEAAAKEYFVAYKQASKDVMIPKKEFDLDTGIGRFRALEFLGKSKKHCSNIVAVTKMGKVGIVMILEAPSQEWENMKNNLLEIAKTINFAPTSPPGKVIFSS